MIFFTCKTPNLAQKNAAPAVIQKMDKSGLKSAFTLIEVLTVVVIIGILSSLAYAGLMELILTNRAKETAQTMRTFAERALAEGKRQSDSVTIKLNVNSIEYYYGSNKAKLISSEVLNGGFNVANFEGNSNAKGKINECIVPASTTETLDSFNGTNGITSSVKIGISGMEKAGYFATCGARGYCGAAVKTKTNNSFVACIKRGNSANWEVL